MSQRATKMLLFAILAIVMAACSRTPQVVTDHDTTYDFSGLRTFEVLPSSQVGEGRSVLISPFTFNHLRHVVERELGLRYARLDQDDERTPDFTVRYHVVMEERLDVRAYDQRYGFGYYGYRYRPMFMYHPGPAPRVYRQGTLILDMVDNRSGEPIWRGISEQRLRDGMRPEEQRELLERVAKEMLSQFPPVN
ncbi:DUF4136 domain-containing protein [Marinimicrobium alkaliphilum]|uniref:DUF4136 domain-containing protein n=1 Tax=Marinimicrobium alkaliphilum TaxID=2202654 RepID=UPI000DBAAD26|nr:DUF4136 domain-containing protein [Marinimicrobium alkaliphilum]